MNALVGSPVFAAAASGDALFRGLSELTTRLSFATLFFIFVAANVVLARYVWRGRRNCCGCESCWLRAIGRSMLAAACNMAIPFVGYFFVPEQSFSAQQGVVGGNPGADNAPMAMLFVLSVMALVAVFAYCSVAAKAPLPPYRRCDGECHRESARQQDEGSANTVTDAMSALEGQPLNCGVAWERELSAALAKK